ncbi:hypothetical protein IMSAGC002_00278 [Lachnospiraceae bacterium]|nr:hypothetical protein IMSAGC002_00278 [Lachnospiraceae bacterium]
MWEEPCISGQTGSGTVFFSGCNMGCVFCQNHPISKGITGKKVSPQRLEEIFLQLQEQKACNINLVTPTHFIPQIRQALQSAKSNGLTIPVVYNTSSYEKAEALRTLEGLIDIYLPDLKYFSPVLSKKYSLAQDYFIHASAAIEEMVRQTGRPVFTAQKLFSHETSTAKEAAASNKNQADDDYLGPLMKKGVIVRHLVLPGCTEDSKKIIQYLYTSYKNDIYISIMSQYTPIPDFLDSQIYPELSRPVSPEEYDIIVDYAVSLGVENGFIQDETAASESFIPTFDCYGL